MTCLIYNVIEHTTSIKEILTPFTNPNDKRFKWLINDSLSYIDRWQKSIEGNFTTADEKKMFLSQQTYTGILINVHSIIEMVSYLLRDGTDHNYCHNDDDNIQKFVLTERVSQEQRRILDVIGLLGGVMNTRHCINSVMTQI